MSKWEKERKELLRALTKAFAGKTFKRLRYNGTAIDIVFTDGTELSFEAYTNDSIGWDLETGGSKP